MLLPYLLLSLAPSISTIFFQAPCSTGCQPGCALSLNLGCPPPPACPTQTCPVYQCPTGSLPGPAVAAVASNVVQVSQAPLVATAQPPSTFYDSAQQATIVYLDENGKTQAPPVDTGNNQITYETLPSGDSQLIVPPGSSVYAVAPTDGGSYAPPTVLYGGTGVTVAHAEAAKTVQGDEEVIDGEDEEEEEEEEVENKPALHAPIPLPQSHLEVSPLKGGKNPLHRVSSDDGDLLEVKMTPLEAEAPHIIVPLGKMTIFRDDPISGESEEHPREEETAGNEETEENQENQENQESQETPEKEEKEEKEESTSHPEELEESSEEESAEMIDSDEQEMIGGGKAEGRNEEENEVEKSRSPRIRAARKVAEDYDQSEDRGEGEDRDTNEETEEETEQGGEEAEGTPDKTRLDRTKCNSRRLYEIMMQNMDESAASSKRGINARAEAEFKHAIDVICSRGHFSYVFSSNLYCEARKAGVTCVAFHQAPPKRH